MYMWGSKIGVRFTTPEYKTFCAASMGVEGIWAMEADSIVTDLRPSCRENFGFFKKSVMLLEYVFVLTQVWVMWLLQIVHSS